MNATLSMRQLRIVVMLGLLVLCAAGYWIIVPKHKSATQPSTATSTPAATKPATTTPAPSQAHPHTATPSTVATHGLPLAVVQALTKHSVVVVSLSSPHSDVDHLAAAEAQAGARAMHAGYVNLNVHRQRPGTAILRKLGVVDTPDLLVVKRPYLILSEFNGFVDRDVVEQAVVDAR